MFIKIIYLRLMNFELILSILPTIALLKRLVRVKNCVTTIITLPGIAVNGTMKLKTEVITTAMQGK